MEPIHEDSSDLSSDSEEDSSGSEERESQKPVTVVMRDKCKACRPCPKPKICRKCGKKLNKK